jgi:hypothetical protein
MYKASTHKHTQHTRMHVNNQEHLVHPHAEHKWGRDDAVQTNMQQHIVLECMWISHNRAPHTTHQTPHKHTTQCNITRHDMQRCNTTRCTALSRIGSGQPVRNSGGASIEPELSNKGCKLGMPRTRRGRREVKPSPEMTGGDCKRPARQAVTSS